MAVSSLRYFCIFRINQINRVMRTRPGFDEILAREYPANLPPRARVVHDDIAVIRETDADDDVAILPFARWRVFQYGVGDGHGDGNAVGDQIFELADVAQPAHVSAYTENVAGVS